MRQAARGLWRTPGFTAVAVVTLGLGIGASTAIFSVVEGVLLRSLPYPEPDGLVRVFQVNGEGQTGRSSHPNLEDVRASNRTSTGLAQYAIGSTPVMVGEALSLTGIAWVSGEFFDVVGIQPAIGRGFVAEEVTGSGAPVAVVSHEFWQGALGGVRDLSSLTLRLQSGAVSVVGVMPPGFKFPGGADVDVIAPFTEAQNPARTAHNWWVLGRLRDGVTLAQARQDLSAIARRLKAEYGDETWMVDAAVIPLHEYLVGNVRPALLVLLAAWGVDALLALEPGQLPRLDEIGVNATVLGYALGVSVLTATALGLIMAWRATRADVRGRLAASQRTMAGGASSRRVRSALVVAEVAMTIVLLAGAGLLMRSFARLLAVDPGFRTEGAVVMDVMLPAAWDQQVVVQNRRFLDELVQRIRAVPGVEHVGVTDAPPLSGRGADGMFLILDRPDEVQSFDDWLRFMENPDRTGHAEYRWASGDYFRAMGIPLVAGRPFDERDHADAPHVAVISESLARTRWPGEDPIGKLIQFGNMDGDLRAMTIVGVVGDVRHEGLEVEPSPMFYGNAVQRPVMGRVSVVISGPGAQAAIGPARAAAQSLTRFLAGMVYGIGTTDPATFAGVAGMLLGVAVLASWVPAWRAVRVDPMVALREE